MKELLFSKKMFGGQINFVVYDDDGNYVKKIISEVYNEGLRLQKIFNIYDSKSELSLLNKKRKMKVSDDLIKLIKKSLKFSKLTRGNYDVTLGKYILLRKNGKKEIPNCSYEDLIIKGMEVTLINPEIMIDLGSIAKGYIADKLADFLEEKEIKEFLIDARGDIVVRGNMYHVLGIQNPRKDSDICFVKLKNQAIATSGDYMQYSKNFKMSHIVNQKNIISVSVISKRLEDADVYATAIFTSPNKYLKKIIRLNKKNKILIVDEKRDLKMFNGFDKIIYKK